MFILLQPVLIFLSLVGIADAGFITYEEYIGATPSCHIGSIFDCGAVLNSSWSHIGPLPLSVLGLGYYCTMLLLGMLLMTMPKYHDILTKTILALTAIGALFSVFLMYLQLVVIQALCLYCTISAFTSALLFLTGMGIYFGYQKTKQSDKGEE